MSGTILENLSGRKLSVLVSIFLVLLIACFLIGLIVEPPPPAGTQQIIARVCVDRDPGNKSLDRWFDPRTCEKTTLLDIHKTPGSGLKAENLVFAMQMPQNDQDFSRWQQNLFGILQIEFELIKDSDKLSPVVELTLDVSLAYGNRPERNVWHPYAHSRERRYMDCATRENRDVGHPNSCSVVPLFELGSLHHDFYLLNMRLPADESKNKFGRVDEVILHIIHMNGGFTKVWVGLKCFFFPIITAIVIWFWRRVHILERTPALLEYMLVSLAGTLVFLDMPLEVLSLYVEMPFLLLFGDIRQGVFYAMLLSFWLIFAGEHMLIQDTIERRTLRAYWKHLSAIITGCTSLLIFDLCERGVQLRNPFYSIWVTPLGTNLALSFIILAGISASIYFLFLCYMIWRVFRNIGVKRSVLPSMSSARRLHYEGIIYRFNFLMLATVVCAAVTIISFILSQVGDGQYKWDDQAMYDDGNVSTGVGASGATVDAGAMYTGVFGMWNVYICAVVILYAPSHKRWPAEPQCGGENAEEVEFNRLPSECSANEISSLTSFASKAAMD